MGYLIKQEKCENLKSLWGEYISEATRDKIIDAVIKIADEETLNWFKRQYLTETQRDKIIDAVIKIADEETLNWFKRQYLTQTQRDNIVIAIIEKQGNSNSIYEKNPLPTRLDLITNYDYDFFICHASEDKDSFVRPLAKELKEREYQVWYDEFALTLGDRLRQKIDYGLANCCFGIVVLSKFFFEKDWPQKELDGLDARERNGKKVILPVWHGVTREDVEKFSPMLAGRVHVKTDKGLDKVVKEIIRAYKMDFE